MPGGDRTGPWGAGPLTGWGRGVCGRGRGAYADECRPPWRPLGGDLGWGRGWRHRYWATGSPGWQRGGRWGVAAPWGGRYGEAPEEEQQLLEREAEALEGELTRVRARLDELRTTDD